MRRNFDNLMTITYKVVRLRPASVASAAPVMLVVDCEAILSMGTSPVRYAFGSVFVCYTGTPNTPVRMDLLDVLERTQFELDRS